MRRTSPPRTRCSLSMVGGGTDAFVAKLAPSGSQLLFSTFLGGSHSEYGRAVAVDSFGNAFVAGSTMSINFPTENPLQPEHGGDSFNTDAFVVKIGEGSTNQ